MYTDAIFFGGWEQLDLTGIPIMKAAAHFQGLDLFS